MLSSLEGFNFKGSGNHSLLRPSHSASDLRPTAKQKPLLAMISTVEQRHLGASQALSRTLVERLDVKIDPDKLKPAFDLPAPSRRSQLASYFKSYQSFLCRCLHLNKDRKAERYLTELLNLVASESSAAKQLLPLPETSQEHANRFLFHEDLSADLKPYAKSKSEQFIQPLSDAIANANDHKQQIWNNQKAVLKQAIEDAITQYQHHAFLNKVSWFRTLKHEVQEHLFEQLTQHDAYAKEHPIETKRMLQTALRTMKPHYQLDQAGGRFESLHKTRMPGSQIMAASGAVFQLINTPTPAQWEKVKAQQNIRQRYLKSIFKNSGGFGTVRLAQSCESDEIVAAKKFKNRKDAQDEVKAYQSLEPRSHILKLIDHAMVSKEDENGRLIDKPYAFLEYANRGTGLSQSSRLAKLRRADPSKAEQMLKLTAYNYILALTQIHEQGACHRDVKPDNFLQGDFGQRLDDGQVRSKIADLGMLTKNLNEKPERMVPHYVPPEIVTQNYYGPAHDVFAMGLVLLFLKHNEDAAHISGPHLEVEGQPITLDFKGPFCLGVAHKDLPCMSLDELIYSCLSQDVSKRITSQTLLNSPYFNDIRSLVETH